MRLLFVRFVCQLPVALLFMTLPAIAQNSLPAGNYTVLPVKYVYFSASTVRNHVCLKWTADNEVNHSYFDLERSFDGRHFFSTGIIIQGPDNGISNKYEVKDKPVIAAINSSVYYRLKHVDFTGTITYSTVAMVKLDPDKTAETLANPSPFTDRLCIHFVAGESGHATIRLQQLTGENRFIEAVTIVKGKNTFDLSGLGNLPKGIYIAQVSINGTITDNQKIVKS